MRRLDDVSRHLAALTAAQLIKRLSNLAAEERTLRVLLRTVRARDRCRQQGKAVAR